MVLIGVYMYHSLHSNQPKSMLLVVWMDVSQPNIANTNDPHQGWLVSQPKLFFCLISVANLQMWSYSYRSYSQAQTLVRNTPNISSFMTSRIIQINKLWCQFY